MSLLNIFNGDLEATVWAKINAWLVALSIAPVVDGETGLEARTKINEGIDEVNSSTSVVADAYQGAFPNTFFVSPTGSDSNDGTSPDDAHAWLTTDRVNAANTTTPGTFVAGSSPRAFDCPTVLYKRGTPAPIYFGTLQPPVANMRFGAYGDPDDEAPIVGHPQYIDPADAGWVDDSAGSGGPGVWYIDIYLDIRANPLCAFWTLTDSLGFWEGRGLSEGTVADMSVDVKGVDGNWSNLGVANGMLSTLSTIWFRSSGISFTSEHPHYAISIDGASPTGTKLNRSNLSANGDFSGSNGTNTISIFNDTNKPSTAYSTIYMSCMWETSTVSGTTRRIRVFTGGQHPSLVFSRILINGKCASGTRSIDLANSGHTFSNIWFTGSDSSIANDAPYDDITFANCKMWLGLTRGVRVELDDYRWTLINCQVDDNGIPGSQDGNGLLIGNSALSLIKDFHMIGGRVTFNGSDNIVANGHEGSGWYLENVLVMGGGENELDLKQFGEMRMAGCVLVCMSMFAIGSGSGPLTVQSKNKVFARECAFINSRSDFSLGGGGNEAIKAGASTFVDIRNSIIHSAASSNGALLIGDDPGSGSAYTTASTESSTEQFYQGCLITNTATGGSSCLRTATGTIRVQQCTLANRNGAVDGKCISMRPGDAPNATYSMNGSSIAVKNSILWSEAVFSAGAWLVDRNSGAASTGNVLTLDDCTYFHANNPTNWARGDSVPTNYTEANINSGISLGSPVYFRVTNNALVTDPTADPMFDNPWEGMGQPSYPDFRVGNYLIGGNLYVLEFSSAPATPVLKGVKVRGVTSGATGYVRNYHNSGGPKNYVLSSVVGTFTNGEVIKDQFQQTIGTLAGSGAFVGPLVLRTGIWDAQTVNYSTMGQILTGTGGTGYLLSQQDAGSTGRFVIAVSSSVTFADNDVVTGAVEGSATINGVLRESPAKASCAYVRPEITYTCIPSNQSFDVDSEALSFTKGSDEFYRVYTPFLVAGSTDTFSINTGTRTWSRSGSGSFAGLHVGEQIKTNNAGATIDAGGPYTIETVSVSSFTTVETPGATVTNDSNMMILLSFGQDAGCYPISAPL